MKILKYALILLFFLIPHIGNANAERLLPSPSKPSGFGGSLDISGDSVIVGASYDNSAFVFVRGESNWDQQATLASTSTDDRFGVSVSIFEDYALVGAYQDNEKGINAGAAYVFKRDGNNWLKQAKLTAFDGEANDSFGVSVSISTNYAVVGAHQDDDNGTSSGSVYVFERNGTNWTNQAKLTSSDARDNDLFGCSLDLSGDVIVVGALLRGKAYVFRNQGSSNWNEEAILTHTQLPYNIDFGYKVAIWNDYIAVGAPGDTVDVSQAGAAYVFKRDGANWPLEAKIAHSDASEDDAFGLGISICDKRLVVGNRNDDENGINVGAAYVFERNNTNWTEKAKLTPSDRNSISYFGESVSAMGDYVAVGARLASAAYIYDDIIKYTLTMQIHGGGAVSIVPPLVEYSPLTSVSITPQSSNYWKFSYWGNDITGTGAPTNITMISDMVIDAYFTPIVATNDTPLWWLVHYELGTNDTAVLADTDKDGVANWNEYQAGTDPRNPNSVFAISSILVHSNNNEAVLAWYSVTNKTYRLLLCTNLSCNSWQVLFNGILSAPPTNVYNVHTDGDNPRFYRIQIDQE